MEAGPSAPAASQSQSPPYVAVAATFTAEPLGDTLAFWMEELGFDFPVRFAPYGQVFQQLLDPAGLLAANPQGFNVVLVRLEDWARFDPQAAPDLSKLEENARHLIECLRSAARSFSSPLLFSLCPASPAFLADPAHRDFAARMESRLASELGTLHLITTAELSDLYPVPEPDDPHADQLAHIPYTPAYYAALATLVARKIHALRIRPYKVIVLDCDETLWRGVCGEDGPEGIHLDPPRRALQEFMRGQRASGMLLCLVSKNNEEDVLETFRLNPEMPLRLEDFVAWCINWEAKSANLVSLAEELKLGLDSFIFVDDLPEECAEVQADCPEVLALPLPGEPEDIPQFLRHVWAFDKIMITAEDRSRTEMYLQRLERARLERQASTLAEFIASLNLEIRIARMSPAQLARVAQLTQRTNQMNCTTLRRSESDIQALVESGQAECLVAEVTDRFGSYGLTGVMIFRASAEALRVDTFLLSCRALARGVEHRMLARLGEIAEERGLKGVEVPFVPTPRNRPALRFLESVGAAYRQPRAEGLLFRFPAKYAACVTYRPEERPRKVEAAGPAPTASPETTARKLVDYVRIATELNDAGQILERVRSARPQAPGPARPSAEPRTALEAELARMWADLLGVPSVGIHDDFFDLGGHSLLAVELLTRVHCTYGVDLSLDVVYGEAFTVGALAEAIELAQLEQADPSRYAALLEELGQLTDEEARALLAREQFP